jgi:hypothetical protein
MTPSQFRELSWEDQAEMIAHDRVLDKMLSHEQDEHEREQKSKALHSEMIR